MNGIDIGRIWSYDLVDKNRTEGRRIMGSKLTLREGEQVIAKAAASHVKSFLCFPQANPGNLTVTNQRVIFEPTQGRLSSAFEYDLKDISSFSVALANTIKLVTTGNVQHKVTGMFNKKLIQALLEAGVSQK